MTKITDLNDILKLEAQDYAAVFPTQTPYAILKASAQRWPDHRAMIYTLDINDSARNEIYTYRELLANVEAAARLFRSLGVDESHALGLITYQSPWAQTGLWAGELAGCVCPINPMLRADHIAALLRASNAKVILMMGPNAEINFYATLVPALREQGIDLPIIVCDQDEIPEETLGSLQALVESHRESVPLESFNDDPHKTAALYHTGGTTGQPKMVRQTALNQAHVAHSIALYQGYNETDVVVNGLPLFHVAGAFVYGLSVLSVGGCLFIPGRLGMRNRAFIESFWEQAQRYDFSVVGAVPTVLSQLLAAPGRCRVPSLRLALTGGSPLSPELAQSFEEKTSVPVRNVLGMTETSGSIALEPIDAPRVPLSCGYRLPFMSIKVVDPAALSRGELSELDADTAGIVLVRGPNVSAGYTQESLNRGVFLEGGWLVTGDLGYLNRDGRLFITGRAKDVIIRGGHNIDPQMIEDTLLGHPDVSAAAAVGMPDSYAGELPVVFVQLHENAQATEQALMEFVKARIDEPVALPKRLEIIPELPLTPIGKIFKPSLRQIACRWGVEAACRAAGVAREALKISVDANLNVQIIAPPSEHAALKEALVGITVPIEILADKPD